MTWDSRTIRFDNAALDEHLAAWLGWFSDAPMPDEFTALVDQLEAAYAIQKKVEA